MEAVGEHPGQSLRGPSFVVLVCPQAVGIVNSSFAVFWCYLSVRVCAGRSLQHALQVYMYGLCCKAKCHVSGSVGKYKFGYQILLFPG